MHLLCVHSASDMVFPLGPQRPAVTTEGDGGVGGALYETEVVGIQAGNISQRSRDTPEVAV